jgi:uncharacterized repeat protein (TIGR01451 family)
MTWPARHALLVLAFLASTAALAQTASISIDKKGSPNPIAAGADITYTLTISSEGPSDALSVTVNDPLPAGTTFASLASPAGWSCTTPAANGTGSVNCSLPTFPPGSDVFTLVLHTDSSLPDGSTISNTATVATSTNDPDMNDNTAIVITPVVTSSELAVTKSAAPDPAPIGGTLTFTIDFTSSGPSDPVSVEMDDVLPAGTLFNSITAPFLFVCSTPAIGTNGAIHCSKPSVPPSSGGTFTITTTVDPAVAEGTVISNIATIKSNNPDPNPANNSATATVTAKHLSNLGVTKTAAPNPVAAGAPLTYTINVTASGPSSAPNVVLDDPLPVTTTFVSLAAPGGWSCTTPAVGATGTVHCTNASLAAGGGGSFTIVVMTSPTLPAGSVISNTATITGAVTETTMTDNSATATVTTGISSDLALTKSAPAVTFPGSPFTYTLHYSASGPSQASAVTSNDALPATTTFASITAPGFSCTTPAVGAGGTVTCTAVALAAGASGNITIGVKTAAAAPPSTVITNTATISSAAGDTNANNNSATATTTVHPPPITGVKTASSIGFINEGSNVTYTIVLHNGGASAQGDNPGDELTDVLPTSLTLVSASATSGTASIDVPTNSVHWNGAISAGGDVTITINAKVAAGTVNTAFSNQATIHYDGDYDGTNESTTTTNNAIISVVAAVPALSTLLLLALASALMFAGWRSLR